MKRVLSAFLLVVLLATMFTPVFATQQSRVMDCREITLENGLRVVDELIEESNGRSTDRGYTRRRSIYEEDTLIAIVAFYVIFRYDGTTASVAYKSVTQTDTYDGWSYTQTSFTSSGGTVMLEWKLSKLLIFNSSFSMGVTCAPDGKLTLI